MDEDEFYSWLKPSYLEPETQGDIQSKSEESSEISLPGFLAPDKYSALCRDRHSCQVQTLMGLSCMNWQLRTRMRRKRMKMMMNKRFYKICIFKLF
jgi:hypothetical protein